MHEGAELGHEAFNPAATTAFGILLKHEDSEGGGVA
jgi:hypothetical protein